MHLYHLGHVPWLDSQLLYHAMPRVGVEGILLLAPSEPYVCIGYHQDMAQEVDLAYCREHGIPVFRREVGGGAVFLDGRQLFYQIVLARDNPLAAGGREALYRRLLEPVAAAYGDLGVQAHFRPVNDIITAEGRKIAGTGAAEMGDYVVVVGNLIADFDYETMVHVLRVPDEKYRDKVHKTMRDNLTTLRRETGQDYTLEELTAPLIARFEQAVGHLDEAGDVPSRVRAQAAKMRDLFLSDEWLYKQRPRKPGRALRVATGVHVVQRVHKAPGGLLRAVMEVRDGVLADVSLSGDLFCYPQDGLSRLEAALAGQTWERMGEVITRLYDDGVLETPGVTVADWLEVLKP